MAVITIRTDDGRERTVALDHDKPLLFGSASSCPLRIEDPSVPPIHGRIIWRKTRYRVELTPNVPPVYRNGQPVLQASFRQGDSFRIGPATLTVRADASDPAPFHEVQGGPEADAAKQTARGGTAPAARSAPAAAPDEDFDELPDLDALARESEARPEPLRRGRHKRNPVAQEKDETRDEGRLAPLESGKSGLGGLISRLLPGKSDDDPDAAREEKLSSPLLIGLAGAFILLVLIGLGLWSVIQTRASERDFQIARRTFEEGSYSDAETLFRAYVEDFPEGDHVSQARVLAELSRVRSFISVGQAWDRALEAAEAMVEAVGEEPAYADRRMELGSLVLECAIGLSKRAAANADREELERASYAGEVHARIVGEEVAEERQLESSYPGALAQAREAVTKAERRRDALAGMDEALEAGDADAVYAARDRLVATYSDLADDAELRERMQEANTVIQGRVAVDRTPVPGETEERPDRLGPPSTLVIRPHDAQAEPAAGRPEPVFAAVDGLLVALDARDGHTLWQRPVGVNLPALPRAIPGTDDALVFDTRHLDLLRINSQTGELVWRHPVGEPIDCPPLVLGNEVIQTTKDGYLLIIRLDSGDLRARVDIGRPLTGTPVSDPRGRYLYVLGDRDNLFVIERARLECVRVDYLGHAAGSIGHSPVQIARFLIYSERSGLDEGRLHVLVLDEDGPGHRRLPPRTISGWTWQSPLVTRRELWVVGDRNNVEVFSFSDPDDPEPFVPVASTDVRDEPGEPTYAAVAEDGRVVLAARDAQGLDLEAGATRIRSSWTEVNLGAAAAPVQTAADLMILTHQDPDESGLTLRGIDPDDGEVVWATTLGSAWISGLEAVPAEPTADPAGSAATDSLRSELITLDPTGRPVRINSDQLDAGGFVTLIRPRPGTVRLPERPWLRWEAEGYRVVWPPEQPQDIWVARGDEPIRRVPLPVELGARPLVWEDNVLVLGKDGRVQLIDAFEGQTVGAPLFRAFDTEGLVEWRDPLPLGDSDVALLDASGLVQRLVRSDDEDSGQALRVAFERTLDAALSTANASTDTALFTATTDGQIRVVATRDLSPLGTARLEADLAGGPYEAGGHVFLVDARNQILAFHPAGDQLWQAPLGDEPPVGAPAVLPDQDRTYWLDRNGRLHVRALSTGQEVMVIDLDIHPAGGPIQLGDRLVIPTGQGSLRVLPLGPDPTGTAATRGDDPTETATERS